MPDKLEVLAGPGLVARFGELTVWAGPQASAALQAHLVNEAQRLAQAPQCGDHMANSFIAVLQRGDPEPQAPFAAVGPGANGLTLFLHGPVQAWDSGRWLAPQPVPGWMVTSIGRPWPLIILPYGAPPPPQSPPGNPFDLVNGTVPGSGLVILRPTGAPPGTAGQHAGTGAPGQPQGYTVGTGAGPSSPAVASPAGPGPVLVPAVPYTPAQAGGQTYPGTGSPALGAGPLPQAFASPPVVATSPGPGVDLLDLRSVAAGPVQPLPFAGAALPGTEGPQVAGLRCEEGHLNHPRSSTCAQCGRPVATGQAPSGGPRPPLGILLADDGSVWSLDRNCLIGADPALAPEVQAGTAHGIAMKAGTSHVMAPLHAEIQVRDWSVYLVDRGAEGDTCVQAPGAQVWSVLGRHEQRELTTGSHLSCGGRVLTFLSAWPS